MSYVNVNLFTFLLTPRSVASPPAIQSAEQVVSGTTVTVTWSSSSGGAAVTGYIVHYTCNSDGVPQSVAVPSSSTTADLAGLDNGCTYTISVEAQSEHISGESATVVKELSCE